MIKEYVGESFLQFPGAETPLQMKKEEISLLAKSSPPVEGDRSYTFFDANGEPISFNPSFHVSSKTLMAALLFIFFKFGVYHERFRQFYSRVEASYVDGQPIHVARPSDSIIKSYTYEAWKALTSVQMQQELGQKNIIVTGWPLKENISFNEDGLRKVAGTQSRQISISGTLSSFFTHRHTEFIPCFSSDYSIKPSNGDCGATVVSGRVRDIWDNRHPSGKILNALDLPSYNGNTEPTEYATDLHAWDVTRGHHHIDQASSYPTEHMRWALVGLKNSISFVHVDCEGLGTDIWVADGGKVWGFLRQRSGNPLSSINFFLDNRFRLNEVLRSSAYDFEAIAMRRHDRL